MPSFVTGIAIVTISSHRLAILAFGSGIGTIRPHASLIIRRDLISSLDLALIAAAEQETTML
jgi:hypothetical protein